MLKRELVDVDFPEEPLQKQRTQEAPQGERRREFIGRFGASDQVISRNDTQDSHEKFAASSLADSTRTQERIHESSHPLECGVSLFIVENLSHDLAR